MWLQVTGCVGGQLISWIYHPGANQGKDLHSDTHTGNNNSWSQNSYDNVINELTYYVKVI